MILEVKRVYTLAGIKHRYKLSDFAYGEWLIYKGDFPVYYFNIFDTDYSAFKDATKVNADKTLIDKLEKHGLRLKQNLFGISSTKSYQQRFDLEKLPASYLI